MLKKKQKRKSHSLTKMKEEKDKWNLKKQKKNASCETDEFVFF